jgi:hypothetical protein
MSSLLSTSFLERWRKPTQAHIYTAVESNGEDDVEEQKPVVKVNVLDFGNISRRKKWVYSGLIAALWLSTAAILSLFLPAVPKLLQKSRTLQIPQWFPNGEYYL